MLYSINLLAKVFWIDFWKANNALNFYERWQLDMLMIKYSSSWLIM